MVGDEPVIGFVVEPGQAWVHEALTQYQGTCVRIAELERQSLVDLAEWKRRAKLQREWKRKDDGR